MKARSAGSRNFKWNLETRLLLIEILTMVDEDHAAKQGSTASPALGHSEKWAEVASRLPPVFNAIHPSRRGSTCYSQFNQLRQRFKLMRLDHRGRYRRACNGKRDLIMTNALCWTLAAYLDSSGLRRRPGGQQIAVSNRDNELCTASNQLTGSLGYGPPLLEHGHGKQLRASNATKMSLSLRHPKPDHDRQAVALKHWGPLQNRRAQSKLKRKQDVPEMRLYKVSRSCAYRWSEYARLQLIEGVVKMMENTLGKAGQIKSWREIAKGLPKHLFWDMDLDRLADIAKNQFSELRRKYRIMMSDGHYTSGAVPPVKCKTLTKRVLREMAKYEDGCLQRTASRSPRGAVRKLCNVRKENAPWVTVTPSDPNDMCLGARGPVRVEALSRTGIDHENDPLGGVLAEHFDLACDDSIVPDDGSWSSGYDARESADRQTSSEEAKNSESSYCKLLESEDRGYADACEAQDLSNRARNWKRNEGSLWIDNRKSEYPDLQSRQTVSSEAYSIQPHHTIDDSDRHISEEYLHTGRGRSSAISLSSSDRDPESDCHKDTAYLRNPERDSEGSLKRARHPNLDGNKKGDLQRQIHLQRGCRQAAAYERDSMKDENPQNGTESSEYQSESDHGPKRDQVQRDSASENDNESTSHGEADSPSHLDLRFNNNSESGNCRQIEPREEFLNVGERPEIFRWKTSSPAHSQWGETARQGHGTSQSDHLQLTGLHKARPPSEPAKMEGEFRHGDTIPFGTAEKKMLNSSSGPEHDQTCEGPSVLAKILRGVDLEFSKLNWWVKNQVLPQEREKIKDVLTSVLRSLSIANSPNEGVGSDAGCDAAVNSVSTSLQRQIRWVLKAELEQVRHKVFEEIDKSTQVVIQEILQSLKM